MDELAQTLVKRHRSMEEIRQPYEELIQSSLDYVNPRRYDFAGVKDPGMVRKTKQYDGTAQDAFLSWVDGILGWYISKSLLWFDSYIPNRELRQVDHIITYCQEYTEQMGYEFRSSNFYDVFPEYLRDGGGSGTGTMLTEEAKDKKRIIHTVPHPGKVYILEDSEGNVNVEHLTFTLTARQADEKFPGGNFNENFRKCLSDPVRCDTKFDFIQCIFPSDDRAISPTKIGKKKWANVYVLVGSKDSVGLANTATESTVVEIGNGYSYNPATVWRFRKNSDEIYGYSPAMDVMCSITASQQIGKSLIHMGNLAAATPTNIPEEMAATFSMLPNARNTYSDPSRIAMPMPLGGEYPIAKDREDYIHELIRKRYGDQFWSAMIMLAQKTERVPATQVMELRADQAMMLVGQIDNLGSRGIAPIWDSVAAIAIRAGRMPPAPQELLDAKTEMNIKFIGPLAKFQDQMWKTNSLKQTLQTVAGLGQMLGPQVFDGVKVNDTVEYMWESGGSPRDLYRSKDEIIEIQRRRAEQEAVVQGAETMKTMAEGMNKLTKGAEDGSPMEQMVGT